MSLSSLKLEPNPDERLSITRGELARIQEAVILANELNLKIVNMPDTGCLSWGMTDDASQLRRDEWEAIWDDLRVQQMYHQRANADIDMIREREKRHG